MTNHGILDRVYEAQGLDELRKLYDDWAATYDSTISGAYRYCGHEMVVARLRPCLGDDAAILDAGAGSGMVGLAAAKAGFRNVDAMDLSVGMLEVAKERGVYRTVGTGILGGALDYPDDAYDAVASSGVFTPGHAPPSAFDELIRIVRPGGYICFTLRHDVTPPGFPEKFDELSSAGLWEEVDVSEPFQSMPGAGEDYLHRIWLFRVTA